MENNKYEIVVNERQAKTINEALDLYSRLMMGQTEEIRSLFLHRVGKTKINYAALEYILKELKKALYPELNQNAYYGIHDKEDTPDQARIAWDILKVIRHCIAWTNKPEGDIFVDFDTPRQSSETEPLPSAIVFRESFTADPETIEKRTDELFGKE